MKKYIFIAILGLFVLPLAVKAEQFFGFMDNKFYNISGELQAFCFLDKNCYDLQGKQVWNVGGEFIYKPIIAGTSSPISSITQTLNSFDSDYINCEMGGIPNHGMELRCLNTYKTTKVIVDEFVVSTRAATGIRWGSILKAFMPDGNLIDSVSTISDQFATLKLNLSLPTSTDYKPIADIYSSYMDFVPNHLSLKLNDSSQTIFFTAENEFYYKGR